MRHEVTKVIYLFRSVGALLFIATAVPAPVLVQDTTSAPKVPAANGRISGRVIDGETSRPIAEVLVGVVDRPGPVATDLDGRFRLDALPVGIYAIRATVIGYAPVRMDSIAVKAGQATVITLTMRTAPVALQEIEVKSELAARPSSQAGLLAQQKNAPAVSDGISAETMSKTPDSDAGQAVTRVTGVSVLDDKVVVRGLGERYSNTVLNGAEIASPEPDKKFVPLNIFPAGLLDALVASKTATPDRPGDFAGGSVDIRTKEFPDNFVFNIGTSAGYSSLGTFKAFPRGPRSSTDWFGKDNGLRAQPPANPDVNRFAESFQNVWTPANAEASPKMGLTFSVGGRQDFGSDALGYVFSGNYDAGRTYDSERFSGLGRGRFAFLNSDFEVSLGGIANVSYRLGTSHKFGFKNFYSRGSNDVAISTTGELNDPNGASGLGYQMRYLQRFVRQSQLSGEHHLTGLLNSRLEWRGTYGRAGRDDLDNRQVQYLNEGDGFKLDARIPNYRTFALLSDKTYAGQLDWSIPIAFRAPGDAMLKLGVLHNAKDRDFNGTTFAIGLGSNDPDILRLPPEELFAPENVGENGITFTPANTLFPYKARERVRAAYGMVDFEPLPDLRFVGGLRVERWTADLDVTTVVDAFQSSVSKRQTDALWSANLTWRLSPLANLRAAAYRTIAKPDLRELAPGGYAPFVSSIFTEGNPALVRTVIMNGDLRLELYPGAGEVVAVSGFYKKFNNPIVTTLVLHGEFIEHPDNATTASSTGFEFEARKSLRFLSDVLRNFQAGVNLTLVRSHVTLPTRIGVFDPDLTFQGQSPYLLNLSALFQTERLSISTLYNRFGDRIVRYGGSDGGQQGPNSLELGRGSLDAKVKWSLSPRLAFSLSGHNLTNPAVVVQDAKVAAGRTAPVIQERDHLGYTISFGMEYGF